MGNWRILDESETPFDFEDLGFAVTEELGVGKPAITNIITGFGQADGGQFQRNLLPPRQFSLVGLLQGTDPDDLQEKRQVLNAFFDRRRSHTLYYVRNKTLSITSRYNGGLEGNIGTGGYSEKIPLQFIAEDPYFVEIGSTTTVSLNVNSNTVVSNGGTSPAYPVITLEGEGAVTGLENVTTGKVINFNLGVLPGETITIDLRPGIKTVSSDVRGSLFYSILAGSNLTTWTLETGDNTILLSANGELALLSEDGQTILTEDGQTILIGDTLNLTTTDLAFDRRHESYDGAV